jgi:8-oxo-dGTP pyrophosphatase MutT (NUDIX family)
MELKNLTEIWRPTNSIRGKVIAVAKNNNRLLVCEVLDDEGQLKGWMPLGGGIEFCETSEEALKREVFEELGYSVCIEGKPTVYENIYEHHGFYGHEIIFAFPVTFEDVTIYTKERFQIQEDRGSLHWVEWIDLTRFETKELVLFPFALSQDLFPSSKIF